MPNNNILFIIFGAMGDLSIRKLFPAIFSLVKKSSLNDNFVFLGVDSKNFSDEEFRHSIWNSNRLYNITSLSAKKKLEDIVAKLYYHTSDFYNPLGFISLCEKIEKISSDFSINKYVFYLATPYSCFAPIISYLEQFVFSNISNLKDNSKFVFEKPFGRDISTFEFFNRHIKNNFDKNNVFYVDHYMPKEMVQNIIYFRFSNSLLENFWNNKYIKKIQINTTESIGIEKRGSYYDNTGAMIDMAQSHLINLLSLIGMERPKSFNIEDIREKKIEFLQKIIPFTKRDIKKNLILGQYSDNTVENEELIGYREEPDVRHDSLIETFIALKIMINNKRWKGVPFYFLTGKRLTKKFTEIKVYFKNNNNLDTYPNILTMQIYPHQSIFLQFNTKVPSFKDKTQIANMNYDMGIEDSFIDGYERILLDIVAGDNYLFLSDDEIALSWNYFDNINENIRDVKSKILNFYSAGTWGPEQTYELMNIEKPQ